MHIKIYHLYIKNRGIIKFNFTAMELMKVGICTGTIKLGMCAGAGVCVCEYKRDGTR